MTKAELKHLKQLQQKKYRQLSQAFVVEGWKSILEFLQAGFLPQNIWATNVPKEILKKQIPIQIINYRVLQQASFFKNPKDAIAIFKKPTPSALLVKGLVLALDDLQDPGNLGTIIRTADWFGFKHIVCSEKTVDCFNPKVVQASMGSLARVQLFYTDLIAFLQSAKSPVYGAFLNGDNIFKMHLSDNAIIVIGNEGNGIKPAIASIIDNRITIPKSLGSKAESLNASIAAAIIMQEFFRQTI